MSPDDTRRSVDRRAAEGSPRSRTGPWPAVLTRPAVGGAMVLFGLTVLFVGWFGLAGRVRVDEQLPWLLGAGVPGFGFVVLGGVLLASFELRRFSTELERVADLVERLHHSLVGHAARQADAPGTGAASRGPADRVETVPNGVSYHRPGCLLTQGKEGVSDHPRHVIASGELGPCKLCDPDGIDDSATSA